MDSSSTDSEEEGIGEESQDEWHTQSVEGMNLSSNMISQCQRNHSEFCFVVKPAPGSRQITTVGYRRLSEIIEMYFVSNYYVLIKFRGGDLLTLYENGLIVMQPEDVRKYFNGDSKIVGESQGGKKTLLLEIKTGGGLDIEQHVALQFGADGLAKVVGIYDKQQK